MSFSNMLSLSLVLFFAVQIITKSVENDLLNTDIEQIDETLVLIHCLFRHGQRTPDMKELYPKDPHINETFHPYGLGQLTKEGKIHEYNIGKELRTRYDIFLGKEFNMEMVEAKSTDYNRTKMSLQLVLASLFPIEKSNFWMSANLWQPIPYNYEKSRQDFMFLASENCKIFRKYYLEAWNTAEVQHIVQSLQSVYNFLEEETGWSFADKGKAWTLYFGLRTEDEFGLELPKWAKEIYPKPLESFAIMQYYVMMSTVQLRRIFSGFLFKYIMAETFSKINDGYNKNRKIYLYAAHEFNMASFLLSLDIFYPHIPPYGSYLIVEVHRMKEGFGIKVLYQDYTNSTVNYLRIPECNLAAICPLDQFTAILRKYFMELDNLQHC